MEEKEKLKNNLKEKKIEELKEFLPEWFVTLIEPYIDEQKEENSS